jgi:hypothetical protein
MMTANGLNSIGLVFDIIGAVLLWYYGLPANISRGGVQGLALEQPDASEAAKADRYDYIGKGGLILLIIGFVFQLISNTL